jgi:hypothetical protein
MTLLHLVQQNKKNREPGKKCHFSAEVTYYDAQ